MFKRLITPSSTAPATAKDERVYSIGDVHGRLDLLRALIGQIERHYMDLPPVRETNLVILGDLVDRGPETAGVLKMIHGIQQRADHLIVLKGNHEDMMIRALDGEPGVMRQWVRFGGDATLRSYGITPPVSDGDLLPATRDLAAAVPIEIQRWLRALPLTARSGDYFFCHAGVRPGVSLNAQSSADLLWIRDEFLDDRRPLGAVVVHGHSVGAEVQEFPNRIGIDTGAYGSGVLTALYLEGTKREVLQEVGTPDPRFATWQDE